MEEDSNKAASTQYDPNTLPLLAKPYAAAIDPPIASTSETEDSYAQFLQISYNYGPRSFKDWPFLVLFLILVLGTFAFGIFAAANANPHRSEISSFVYDITSSSCTRAGDFQEPLPPRRSRSNHDSREISSIQVSPSFLNYSKSSLSRNFPSTESISADGISLSTSRPSLWDDSIDSSVLWGSSASLSSRKSSLLNSLIWTLVITLILSVPFALCVLFLLRRYAKQIVYASLPFFVIVPIFINVYWFVACTISSRCSDAFPLSYRILVLVFVFLIIGLIVWIFVVNWHKIELTVSIIGVGAHALSTNLGLFFVLPALTLALFLYYAPVVVFLVFANKNGKIAPKEKNGEYFCAWKQDSWVPAYYALAILTMLWSATIMIETQLYVISGTIAQWYFSKDDSRPKHAIQSSLRNAFGPSSGTICFSGLLLGIVRIVRSMVDNARQEDSSGIVNLMLRCCVSSFLTAVDFLNKFTLNFAAITGESYCNGAKMTYELLKRNLLSTVFVETVSTRILAGIAFVLSAIYAIVVCVILKAIHLRNDSYIVAAGAWAVLLVVLGFLMHVLDDVIDTVYVCYAIDRDRGEVYKQEVHEVYVHLPISRNHRAGFPARSPPMV